MSIVCYFVGGPLDLSKQVRHTNESRLFALDCPAFTLIEIEDRTGTIGPAVQEHEYVKLGKAIHPDEVGRDVFIYGYNGLRRR